MPEITTDDVTKIAKDALYVGVGAGVIVFQKAQVQRVQLTEAVTTQVAEAKTRIETLAGSVDGRVKLVEERLDAVEERFEAILDDLEAKLPEQARDVVKQARETAKDARTQVRAVVGRAA